MGLPPFKCPFSVGYTVFDRDKNNFGEVTTIDFKYGDEYWTATVYWDDFAYGILDSIDIAWRSLDVPNRYRYYDHVLTDKEKLQERLRND